MNDYALPSLALLGFDVQQTARAIIEKAILDHPRGLQAEIGASEIGTPCERKLAFKLSSSGPSKPERAAWRPTVGTAVHAWLQLAFDAENQRLGWDRWLTEERIEIGELVPGRMLTGNCDLFDRLTGTVLDWKIPGVTTIKKARAARDPGQQYRTQAHLYGLGWARRGEIVRDVAIYYLPAAGELSDGYYWTEPFDPALANAALQRAALLIIKAGHEGWDELIPTLPITDDHCVYCPWWQPETTDLDRACPGAIDTKGVTPTGPLFGSVATRGTA